jgi:hypothetical protein
MIDDRRRRRDSRQCRFEHGVDAGIVVQTTVNDVRFARGFGGIGECARPGGFELLSSRQRSVPNVHREAAPQHRAYHRRAEHAGAVKCYRGHRALTYSTAPDGVQER